MRIPQATDLMTELSFSTSRSSGPGGQNVNKVNTKVSLRLDVMNSNVLTTTQKELILKKLSTRITKEGELILTSQDMRSQLDNKETVIDKLNSILVKVFTPRKIRKATKPTQSSRQKRIKAKKHRAEKKQWRQPPQG